MSIVGKGDPRWLVKNREDGKNVNKWHWSEKDVFSWVKDKIAELFADDIVVDDDQMKIVITDTDEMEGSFSINNRKAKLIFIYDFNLTLYWKGEMKETGATGSGKIDCVDINVTDDKYDIYVTLTNEDSMNAPLRNFLKSKSFEYTKSKIDTMINELRQSIGDDANNTLTKSKEEFETFNSIIHFQHVNPNRIYNILTKQQMVSAFTGVDSTMRKVIGSQFELYGGSINGKIENLIENTLIQLKWRFSTWRRGHYSDVSIHLESSNDLHTTIRLDQTNIPKSEIEKTKKSWDQSYWLKIMAIYGYMYEIE